MKYFFICKVNIKDDEKMNDDLNISVMSGVADSARV